MLKCVYKVIFVFSEIYFFRPRLQSRGISRDLGDICPKTIESWKMEITLYTQNWKVCVQSDLSFFWKLFFGRDCNLEQSRAKPKYWKIDVIKTVKTNEWGRGTRGDSKACVDTCSKHRGSSREAQVDRSYARSKYHSFWSVCSPARGALAWYGDFCLKSSRNSADPGWKIVVMAYSKRPGSLPESQIQPSYDLLKADFSSGWHCSARFVPCAGQYLG